LARWDQTRGEGDDRIERWESGVDAAFSAEAQASALIVEALEQGVFERTAAAIVFAMGFSATPSFTRAGWSAWTCRRVQSRETVSISSAIVVGRER